MAYVNYQFEKRRRDLEKKQKQEAKRQRKLERKKQGESRGHITALEDEQGKTSIVSPDIQA